MAASLEQLALQSDFEAAVRRAGTRLLPGMDEATQRRLFGLYHRVTSGPAPATPVADLEEAQMCAWAEVSDLSTEKAMHEYVDIVESLTPMDAFVSDDEEGADEVSDALKQQLIEQLSVGPAVISAAPEVDNIFDAVRGGTSLAAYLPSQRDTVDEDGLTALHHAVDAENIKAVEQLLLAGASTNALDSSESSPLHFAALLGAADIAKRLLEARADPTLLDNEGKDAITLAQGAGHSDLAELIQQRTLKSTSQ